MKVQAISMSNLMKKCDDIYTAVMIVSKRARQIIDQRVIPIEENEEVEDSIEFSEPEIVIEDVDKPMVVALEEYLQGELEWRQPEEFTPESDEA
jgi:DNA-directed RNA polymerase omega subunit